MENTPPHDIMGKKVAQYLPKGEGSELFLEVMEASREVFADHPVNRKRAAEGKLPGNSVWLWGQGKAPRMATFRQRFGLSGSVVAAVDLIKGIGIYAGLDVIEVPGATGYTTRTTAERRNTPERARRKDFVLISRGGRGGAQRQRREKVKAIERIDAEMLGPSSPGCGRRATRVCSCRTSDAVLEDPCRSGPFAFYPAPAGLSTKPGSRYTEADARAAGQMLERGTLLIEYLLT